MNSRYLVLCSAVLAVACASALRVPDRDPAAPTAAGPTRARTARIDFGRDVRPILADRCFACHGPDEHQRQAGLRLDQQDVSRAALDSGARAIVPGDIANSELVRRVLASDDEAMPPAHFKRPLTAAQRATLVAWVAQGGDYAPHWAFVAPVRSPRPAVRDAAWVRDPLDQFVLAELEQAGRAPSPAAEPLTLLRRASLVLTGLPPAVADAAAFTRDPTQERYEAMVDTMLASERAAEHMATTWLDLARYADTHGYQSDGESFWWPWRDWLLRSLCDNVPFDRFVQQILAGDLLPDASVDERVATAFWRMHRLTEEGGSIAEEFRQEGIADRVATFGTTFVGLTLECARCHDHKFDPIKARDFYSLAAMFGAIDENGLKPYALAVPAPPPFVRLATSAQAAREAELRANVAVCERALQLAMDDAAVAAASTAESVVVTVPPPDAHYPFDQLVDGATPNRIPGAEAATTDRHRPEQLGAVAIGDGREGAAMHFDGDGGLSLRGLAGFGRHDEITMSMWLRAGERNARAAIVHAAGFYTQDADASGIELELDEGRVRFSAIHLWPCSVASVRTVEALPIGVWTHLVVAYDGSSRSSGLTIGVNGLLVPTEVVRDALDGPLAVHTLEVGSRSRGSGFRAGAIDELRVWRKALTRAQMSKVESIAAARRGIAMSVDAEAQRRGAATAVDHFVQQDPAVVAACRALRAAQRELAAHLDAIPALSCMQDSTLAPATVVLARGAYDQPDRSQPCAPGAVDAVLPFDASLPRNRLGLARWLCDPRHPLTARVAVDRLWAQVFGRGLVETRENFGVQGSVPSHPALLDTLSRDFCDGDGTAGTAWNVRAMLRRFVTSATFAQSSRASAAAREQDPQNAWLARGPSIRLSAEMLRDQALFASGLLHEALGGPSVKPWQPDGLWGDAGQSGNYVASQGTDAHRRSLYTYRKRTVTVPDLAAFDAGSRETCQSRRSSTNTPLQALVIANDPVFFECALGLAARATRDDSDVATRLITAFRCVCTRNPTGNELAALTTLYDTAVARYAAVPKDAAAVCGSESPELAALTLACSAILGTDAAMVMR